MLFKFYGNRFFDERDFGGVSKFDNDKLDEEINSFKDSDEEIEQPEGPEPTPAEPEINSEIETDPEKQTPEPAETPEASAEPSPGEKPDTEEPKPADTEEPAPDTVNILDQQLTDNLLTKLDPNKFSAEEKEYLKKYVGKDLGTALKSLANSQKLIGKKTEQLYKNPSPTPEIPSSPAPVPQNEQQEIVKVKGDLVIQQLRSEYPDIPTDPTERKAWEKEMNYEDPASFMDYREKTREISKNVDNFVNQSVYYRDNWKKINNNTVDAEIDTIKNVIKKTGLTEKDLGIDLVRDKEGDNELINELLFDKEGNWNPKVVETKYGQLMIKEGSLYQAFRDKLDEKILEKIKEKARSGVKGPTQQAEKYSGPKGIVAQNSPHLKKDLSKVDIGKLSDPDLEKLIDEIDI